jgi:phosphatidylglycerophosphatase C
MPEAGRPKPSPSPRTVAAFDFDGTLSTRDNLLPFLRAVAGAGRLNAALAVAAPDLARAALGDRSRRDSAKARVVRRLLRGRDATAVEAVGVEFAGEVVAAHLRRDVRARADWHRAAGHEVVIVSASLGLYLRPVAATLGFDGVIATELDVGSDGRLTGELAGGNVRGAEKVRRLDAWLRGTDRGGATATLWAYGEGPDDRDLLARADHPVTVGRAPLPPAPNAGATDTIGEGGAADGH